MAKKTMKKRNSVKRGDKSMARRMRRTRRKVSRKKYHRKRTKRLKMRGGSTAGVTAVPGNQVITGITQVYVRKDGVDDDDPKCGENCSNLKWFCTTQGLLDELKSPRDIIFVHGEPAFTVNNISAVNGPGWLWVGPDGRRNVFLKKHIEARVVGSWALRKWDYYIELEIKAESGDEKGDRWKFRYKTKQPAAEDAVKMIT